VNTADIKDMSHEDLSKVLNGAAAELEEFDHQKYSTMSSHTESDEGKGEKDEL